MTIQLDWLDESVRASMRDVEQAITELVYAQHTANLIAYSALSNGINAYEAMNQARERLGL